VLTQSFEKHFKTLLKDCRAQIEEEKKKAQGTSQMVLLRERLIISLLPDLCRRFLPLVSVVSWSS